MASTIDVSLRPVDGLLTKQIKESFDAAASDIELLQGAVTGVSTDAGQVLINGTDGAPYVSLTEINAAIELPEGASPLLDENERAALSAADAPSGENPIATLADLDDLPVPGPVVIAASSDEGVLLVDLDGSADVFVTITLAEDITEITFSNPPDDVSRVVLRILQPESGGPYDIPLTAWASTTVSFESEYAIRQDDLPTLISILSFDGMVSAHGWTNARPDLYDVIVIDTSTTLTTVHEGRLLYCSAAVTLTVDGDTEFATHAISRIQAAGGLVTVAASGATVNSIGSKLKIIQHGFGTLKRDVAADTYTLAGDLQA
jgi:hypothetical protein